MRVSVFARVICPGRGARVFVSLIFFHSFSRERKVTGARRKIEGTKGRTKWEVFFRFLFFYRELTRRARAARTLPHDNSTFAHLVIVVTL